MKVLIASTGADISSGAARCLVELACNLQGKGYEVLVTIPKRGNIEIELKKHNIRYRYIHEYHSWYTSEKHKNNNFLLKKLLNYKAFLQMRKLIKNERIDIVHENALTAYVAAMAAESLGIPVVWHIREFMEEDLNISFYNRAYSISKINKSAHIIAISKAIADKWSQIFTAPISVVYDGIPVENYYIKRKITDSKTINIIIYGRIVEPKGQFFFFKGMKYLLVQNENIRCFWAGQIEDQNYYDQINKFINENGISDKVQYLGQVDNMKTVLKDMDVVVVCSKQEGFGRVTVEAMLSGCVVVGSNGGATCELIDDGVNGFLYEEGNIESFVKAMQNLVANINSSKSVGICAQKQAMKRYSIENSIKEIIGIYESVC